MIIHVFFVSKIGINKLVARTNNNQNKVIILTKKILSFGQFSKNPSHQSMGDIFFTVWNIFRYESWKKCPIAVNGRSGAWIDQFISVLIIIIGFNFQFLTIVKTHIFLQ